MNKAFDRGASVVLALIGGFFLVEARGISQSAYGSQVGPNLFPMGLGFLLVLLAVRLFWETFRYPDKEKGHVRTDRRRFAWMLAATLGYVLSLEELGYVISTFLFLMLSFFIMERGKWLPAAAIAFGFSMGAYGLYVHVLAGTLPGMPDWLRW